VTRTVVGVSLDRLLIPEPSSKANTPPYICITEQPVGFSEAGIHKTENIHYQIQNREDLSKKKYIDWFKGQKATTAKRNAGRLKQFCEWIDKTPYELVEDYRYTPDKKAWQRDRKNEIQGFDN